MNNSHVFGVRLLAVAGLLVSMLAVGFLPGKPASAQVSLGLEVVTGGLDIPVQVTNAGDGSDRLFVVERPGRIRVIQNDQLLDEPFLDLTDRVHSDDGEQGLLSLVFHPDYETNGELFVLYTAHDWANTIERFRVSDSPNQGDRDSGQIVLSIPDREPNHNGGTLVFGPDGMLYISTGDEGGTGDTHNNAQNLGSLYGKILRIDIDSGDPYGIPDDNPFVDDTSARPEVWAYGLRNPWRVSFDRETNDLWIADVGQSAWEEINVVPAGTGAGSNFGWNRMEGTHCYEGACDPSLYTLPVTEYNHDLGCSITGGHVYRGQANPALTGRYFFGDFCSGRIWSLASSGDSNWDMTLELETDAWISSFGEDEVGELYVVNLAGVLYRLTADEVLPPGFGDSAFERTWARTDKPVADVDVTRTWMWGPQPFTDATKERYAESLDGERLVQYFDKARMEITHPGTADDGVWYVTNGLLVVEMMDGRIQIGDDSFEPHQASTENVAGDTDSDLSPTYATLAALRDAAPTDDGAVITARLDRNGDVTNDPAMAAHNVTAAHRVQVPGIDHQVASVFWEFMNSSATVYENGELTTDLLFENPFYATGYPLTEAYWTNVELLGKPTEVLVQCFERRCLTYTPGNPDGWQVEAGNVGQHYYRWRHGDTR